MKSIFVTSFIGSVHHTYASPFTLFRLLEKHRSIFISYNISCPSITSYLWFPCDSSTWKFHVIISVTSNLGSIICALLLEFVWKSPPWVLQRTNLVIFFRSFCVCLPSMVEYIDPESNGIKSDLNLTLPSIQFVSTHSIGV